MMSITPNKQKRQKCYIREGAFAYLETVIRNNGFGILLHILNKHMLSVIHYLE